MPKLIRKSFKEFLTESEPEYQWFSFEVEEYSVHVLYDAKESNVLTEAKHKGLPLGGQYSAQLHNAHSNAGQQHLHVYAKNNQLFSLNKDGTAHDKSHQTQIPNKVAKAIANKFPDFTLPNDNFIESAPILVQLSVKSQLLCD